MPNIYTQNGKLLVSGIKPLECSTCPCGTTPETTTCAVCSTGFPVSWQVDLTGITGTCGPGTTCADLNQTYFINSGFSGSSESCGLTEAVVDDCASGITLSIFKTGGNYRLQVNLQIGAGAIVWESTFGTTTPACHTISNATVPYKSDNFPNCNGSASNCVVTVL